VTRPRPHRNRLAKPSAQEKALRAWLEFHTGDPVATGFILRVIRLHAQLIGWMAAARDAQLQLAQPQRRHSGDPRDRWRGITGRGTLEPDDPMVNLIDRRTQVGDDPEHLDPIRQRMTHKLGELAGWYGERAGIEEAAEEWEPLATRLGDLIGDQVAANAIAFCLLRHRRLAVTPYEEIRRHHKAAQQRWRRLVEWYVRVLDDQPTRPPPERTGRPQLESVGPDGERRVG
jgi:hypothetical protein